MITKESFHKKLLVEGNDEFHVIMALAKKYQIMQNFDIIDCKGYENLIKQFPVRIKQSEISTIGIIIDADTDIENKWSSIRNLLIKSGFPDSIELNENGLITQNADIRFGLWIMPDNKLNGMLEDFISFLIPKDDNLIPVVNNSLDFLETNNLNKYPIIHKSKAKLHTWLAWQKEPGTPLGLSITKRFLDSDNDNCLKFIKWLKNLYQTE